MYDTKKLVLFDCCMMLELLLWCLFVCMGSLSIDETSGQYKMKKIYDKVQDRIYVIYKGGKKIIIKNPSCLCFEAFPPM